MTRAMAPLARILTPDWMRMTPASRATTPATSRWTARVGATAAAAVLAGVSLTACSEEAQPPMTTETTAMRKVEQWSGRLVLTLDNGARRKPWWADRKRWSLESRLPLALASAEEWAQGVRQQREAADMVKRKRVEAWDKAVPQARAAYVDALNRDRLIAQRDAFVHADGLRSYAAAIEEQLPSLPQEKRTDAHEWISWIKAEADRVDPLLPPRHLYFERPKDMPVTEVDRFMPGGMTSAGPPD